MSQQRARRFRAASSSQRPTRPGTFARARFSQLRRNNIRRDRRMLLGFAAMAVVALVMIVVFDGLVQLVGAWILGFVTAIGLVGWMIAFDARALSWLQGAIGEEWTGDELEKLGPGWHVFHDISHGRGNWDHVIVGPAGVFLLESKRLSGKVVASTDGLTAGRVRIPAAAFRGAAYRLKEEIGDSAGSTPWVQAVVVIWGEFPQSVAEEDRVFYLSGDRLTDWLVGQPLTLPPHRVAKTARAIESITGARTLA